VNRQTDYEFAVRSPRSILTHPYPDLDDSLTRPAHERD